MTAVFPSSTSITCCPSNLKSLRSAERVKDRASQWLAQHLGISSTSPCEPGAVSLQRWQRTALSPAAKATGLVSDLFFFSSFLQNR